MFRLSICLFCLAAILSARPRHVISKTVPDQFRALSLDKQKLTGILGGRVRANSEGFLENLDPQALVATISSESLASNTSERQFPGLFLDAAADAYEYNHDLQLRAQMDKVATSLDNIYQSRTPFADNNWSVEQLYAVRCDLTGLLAYHRVTIQPSAYLVARKITNALAERLAQDSTEGATSDDAVRVALLGFVEPVVRLYRLSGEKKYMDLCVMLAGGKDTSYLVSAVSPSTLATRLAAIRGLADLYEVTGDRTYLGRVVSGWKGTTANGIAVTGVPLSAGREEEPIDTCTAASWMQLTFKLLRTTGDSIYADQLERTVYNQILAAQDIRSGDITPAVALNGSKHFSSKLTGDTGVCMLREAKALALVPQLVWGRYDHGIAINLYTPGRAFFTLRKHGLVQIYTEGTFPLTGQLQLHVEPSVKVAQFPLRLRVPEWTSDYQVDIAGIHLKGRPGDVVIVDREWKSGDTVRISMTLPVTALNGVTAHTGREAELAGTKEITLRRGPQILALGRTLNPDVEDLALVSLRPSPSGHYQLMNYEDKLPRDFNGEQVYRIAGDVAGKPRDLLLVPFSDAIRYRIQLRHESN